MDAVSLPARPSAALGEGVFLFAAGVVLVQGVHVVEHVIQLLQV